MTSPPPPAPESSGVAVSTRAVTWWWWHPGPGCTAIGGPSVAVISVHSQWAASDTQSLKGAHARICTTQHFSFVWTRVCCSSPPVAVAIQRGNAFALIPGNRHAVMEARKRESTDLTPHSHRFSNFIFLLQENRHIINRVSLSSVHPRVVFRGGAAHEVPRYTPTLLIHPPPQSPGPQLRHGPLACFLSQAPARRTPALWELPTARV